MRLSHGSAETTAGWVELLKAYHAAGCDEAALDFAGLDEDLAKPGALERILDAAGELALRRGEIA